MKKKIGIIGILSVAFIAIALSLNAKSRATTDISLANLIALNVATAETTVKGCDTDPSDKCYSAETGKLLASDCDPSSFWHTCKE